MRAQIAKPATSTREDATKKKGNASGRCAACADSSVARRCCDWPVPPQLRALDVSTPRDASERAADVLADRALGTRGTATSARIQSAGPPTSDPLGAAGRPMAKPLRQDLSARFGYDFSNVRIFADGEAARAADALGAAAFTVGQNVYFNRGQYQPTSSPGRSLLAHELAHTIQQRTAPLAIHRKLAGGCAEPFDDVDEQRDELSRVGGAAHRQIQYRFRHALAHERRIPRANKKRAGESCPGPRVTYGAADLVKFGHMSAHIGEIKSVDGADYAAPDVKHYLQRGNEAASRLLNKRPCGGPADQRDRTWDDHWFDGGIERTSRAPALDVLDSVIPRTPTRVGRFWGNPKKDLSCELRDGGAVVYWCTDRRRRRKKEQPEERVQPVAEKPKPKEKQVRVVQYDPQYYELLKDLPGRLAAEGSRLVFAIPDPLYFGLPGAANMASYQRFARVELRDRPIYAFRTVTWGTLAAIALPADVVALGALVAMAAPLVFGSAAVAEVGVTADVATGALLEEGGTAALTTEGGTALTTAGAGGTTAATATTGTIEVVDLTAGAGEALATTGATATTTAALVGDAIPLWTAAEAQGMAQTAVLSIMTVLVGAGISSEDAGAAAKQALSNPHVFTVVDVTGAQKPAQLGEKLTVGGEPFHVIAKMES